jgi:hypothetical protein
VIADAQSCARGRGGLRGSVNRAFDWALAARLVRQLPDLSSDKGGSAMSNRGVGIAISRLLTSEEFRSQFALNPLGTLADLHLEGVDLTIDEMRVFIQTDFRTWLWNGSLVTAHRH